MNEVSASTDNRPHSCPADDVRDDLLYFGYRDRAAVTLVYHSSGCISVTNGHREIGWPHLQTESSFTADVNGIIAPASQRRP